jgi:hypothetical protein
MLKSVVFSVLVFSALIAYRVTSAAQNTCKPLVGSFEATVVPPPPAGTCTAAFCTEGRVWGGLHGTYEFSMSGAPIYSGEGSVFFFTGQSIVKTQSGDLLYGTDTGSLDLGPNAGFASLITFTGGTGAMQGATGQIRLRGELGPGTTSGDYLGMLCTP